MPKVERSNKDSSLPVIGGTSSLNASAGDTIQDHSTANNQQDQFNVEEAWAEIRKVPFREGLEMGVNFAGFEAWYSNPRPPLPPSLAAALLLSLLFHLAT